MKRDRLRRVLKWAGSVTCALIVIAAVADLRWSIWWRWADSGEVGIAAGSIVFDSVDRRRKNNGLMVHLAYADASEAWESWTWEVTMRPNLLYIPLWIPLAAIGAPTLWLWRLDRRRSVPGACRCGYDLTGNTSGRCPECGQIVRTESHT